MWFFKRQKDDLQEKIEKTDKKIKPETELDNLLDNELNFDIGEDLESDVKKQSKKRHPVTDTFIGVVEQFKPSTEMARDITRSIEREMFNVGTVISDVTTIKSELGRLKYDVLKGLQPTIKEFKSLGRRFLGLYEEKIPERFRTKLEKIFEESAEYKTKSIEQERQELIKSQIAAIFEAQQAALQQQQEQQEVKEAIKERIEESRHAESVSILAKIANAVRTSSLFLTTTYKNYLIKDLELKYRSLFVLQDILSITKGILRVVDTKLEAIIKNTGLPDILKEKQSETLMRLRREALMGRITQTITDWFSGFTTALVKNLREQVKMQMDQILGTASMLSMAGGMALDAAEMSKEMGIEGPSVYRTSGGMLGGILRPLLINKLTKKLIEKYNIQAKNIDELVKSLRYKTMLTLKEKAKEGKGIWKFLYGIIPDISERRFEMENVLLKHGTEPVPFDVLTRRTIIEIIPGYLAKIHAELVAIRQHFGAEALPEEEELKYDVYTETFAKAKDIKKRIEERLYGTKEERTSNIQRLIEQFFKQYEKAGGKKEELLPYTDDLIKFFTNLSFYALPLNHSAIKKLIDNKELNDEEQTWFSKAFKGIENIDNIVKAFDVIYERYGLKREVEEEETPEETGKINKILKTVKGYIPKKEELTKEELNKKLEGKASLAAIENELYSFMSEMDRKLSNLGEITLYGYKHLMKEYISGQTEDIRKQIEQDLRKEFERKYGKNWEKNIKLMEEFKNLLEQKTMYTGTRYEKIYEKLTEVNKEQLIKSILGEEQPGSAPSVVTIETKPKKPERSIFSINTFATKVLEYYSKFESLLTYIKDIITQNFKKYFEECCYPLQQGISKIPDYVNTIIEKCCKPTQEYLHKILDKLSIKEPEVTEKAEPIILHPKKKEEILTLEQGITESIPSHPSEFFKGTLKKIIGKPEPEEIEKPKKKKAKRTSEYLKERGIIKDFPHISGPGKYFQFAKSELHIPLDKAKDYMGFLKDMANTIYEKFQPATKSLTDIKDSLTKQVPELLSNIKEKLTPLKDIKSQLTNIKEFTTKQYESVKTKLELFKKDIKEKEFKTIITNIKQGIGKKFDEIKKTEYYNKFVSKLEDVKRSDKYQRVKDVQQDIISKLTNIHKDIQEKLEKSDKYQDVKDIYQHIRFDIKHKGITPTLKHIEEELLDIGKDKSKKILEKTIDTYLKTKQKVIETETKLLEKKNEILEKVQEKIQKDEQQNKESYINKIKDKFIRMLPIDVPLPKSLKEKYQQYLEQDIKTKEEVIKSFKNFNFKDFIVNIRKYSLKGFAKFSDIMGKVTKTLYGKPIKLMEKVPVIGKLMAAPLKLYGKGIEKFYSKVSDISYKKAEEEPKFRLTKTAFKTVKFGMEKIGLPLGKLGYKTTKTMTEKVSLPIVKTVGKKLPIIKGLFKKEDKEEPSVIEQIKEKITDTKKPEFGKKLGIHDLVTKHKIPRPLGLGKTLTNIGIGTGLFSTVPMMSTVPTSPQPDIKTKTINIEDLKKSIVEALRSVKKEKEQIREGSYKDYIRDKLQTLKEKREKHQIQTLDAIKENIDKLVKIESKSKDERKGLFGKLTGIFGKFKNMFSGFVGKLIGKGGILTSILGGIIGLPTKLGSIFGGLLSKLPGRLGSILGKVFGKSLKGILSIGKKGVGTVLDAGKFLLGKFGKVGSLLGRLGSLTRIGSILGGLGGLGSLGGIAGTALSALGPIGLVAGGAFGLYELWKHKDWIKEKLGKGWDWLKEKFSGISDKVKDIGGKILKYGTPLGLVYTAGKKLLSWISPKEAHTTTVHGPIVRSKSIKPVEITNNIISEKTTPTTTALAPTMTKAVDIYQQKELEKQKSILERTVPVGTTAPGVIPTTQHVPIGTSITLTTPPTSSDTIKLQQQLLDVATKQLNVLMEIKSLLQSNFLQQQNNINNQNINNTIIPSNEEINKNIEQQRTMEKLHKTMFPKEKHITDFGKINLNKEKLENYHPVK